MKNISVIIPVHNRPRFVVSAVNSVLAQSRKASEIIVIDDGSTDNTPKALEQFGRQIIYIRQDNKGISAARNAGIKIAKSEWLAFLDSDDEWLPDKIENAVIFCSQNPQYKIFQSQEIWIRNSRIVNPKIKHQKTGGWIFKESLPLCIVSPSASLIRQEVFDDIGLFDENFPVCEDYDLWLRILRKYPIGLDETPGIKKYGGHPDQLSHKYWGMDYYRVLAMEKHIHGPELDEEMRTIVLREIVKKLKVLASGARKRHKYWKEVEEKLSSYQEELRNRQAANSPCPKGG
jgi:glycosyltransferase involved in cell wall biosynthesis